MTKEDYRTERAMPHAKRVVGAAAVLIGALALIGAMLIINNKVGLWDYGTRLDTTHRFVPGTGITPYGPAGSGLHLPLGGK